MRLGIYGGSFDPVHYGHLLLAECCREGCSLDQVWFVPAATAPHKRDRRSAPAKARLEMLELALAGSDALRVCSLEIERGGVSYTVETLAAIATQQPAARLFLLMGADSLVDLPTWRAPERICELALPVIVRRAGLPEPNLSLLAPFVTGDQLAEIRALQVEMPLIEHSSTDLRTRAAAGKSLRFRTPRAVEKYIESQGLYRE
ncbi:MAG: nicotinate-nucleotide adenylyltransferase [Pirellulaceae bacterium]|nr:nicotinate-nucleotide adenylyltransferase [Pirellulaceae bacterium]